MPFSGHKVDLPLGNSRFDQKTLPYLGPRLWNTLPSQIRLRRSVNTFKHDLQRLFFDRLQKENNDVFIYYLAK